MPETGSERPWWQGAVIYQVYPRSFRDSNGDGIGDLAGIVDGLDHIADLGADAVWVSPFFKSPMRDYGYDVADYRRVDPIFGSDADADRLIDACHARSLKIIFDLVLCHTSDQHPWFAESRASRTGPRADWYVWADPKPDGTPPNNWLAVFGGPSWTWENRRRQYYLHHFLAEQPNLNWHNPAVVEAMLGEVRHWLDKGVDGLRLDAITTLVHDRALRDNPPVSPYRPATGDFGGDGSSPFVWQEHLYDRDQPEILDRFADLRRMVDAYADRFVLGEVTDVDTADASARYMASAGGLHSCYTFQFLKPEMDVPLLRQEVTRTATTVKDGWPTFAFSNHDAPRVVSRWAAAAGATDADRPLLAKLLLAVLFSLRGAVCLYQGEELGLPEAEVAFEDLQDPWGISGWPAFKGRDGCRTPLPWTADAPQAGFSTARRSWLPVAEAHRPLAIDRQANDPDSVLSACRRLLAWRRERPELREGDVAVLEGLPETLFGLERTTGNSRLLCLFNLSRDACTVPVDPAWRPVDGHGFKSIWETGEVHLPGFGAGFAARANRL